MGNSGVQNKTTEETRKKKEETSRKEGWKKKEERRKPPVERLSYLSEGNFLNEGIFKKRIQKNAWLQPQLVPFL